MAKEIQLPSWATQKNPGAKTKLLVDRMSLGRTQVALVRLGLPGEPSTLINAVILDKDGNPINP